MTKKGFEGGWIKGQLSDKRLVDVVDVVDLFTVHGSLFYVMHYMSNFPLPPPLISQPG